MTNNKVGWGIDGDVDCGDLSVERDNLISGSPSAFSEEAREERISPT